MTRYGGTLGKDDLGEAYRRAGRSFDRQLSQIFVVLKEDPNRLTVLPARGAKKGFVPRGRGRGQDRGRGGYDQGRGSARGQPDRGTKRGSEDQGQSKNQQNRKKYADGYGVKDPM